MVIKFMEARILVSEAIESSAVQEHRSKKRKNLHELIRTVHT